MSRHEDDHTQRQGRPAPADRRGPYEAQRPVTTFGDENDHAAEHPWQAAHPQRHSEGTRRPHWSEQPARYGGGYRGDELWSSPRGNRGDERYGWDTSAERHGVEGYQNEDNRHRAHGYGRSYQAWQEQREYGRGRPGQSNSGYDAARAYGEGSQHDDARSDYARASWTQEHDYQGPRYGGATQRPDTPSRGDYGSQYGHTDTYGGAGFRQQGKRYWFDEGDQRSRYRGTRPRGYERSDERLRELVCEHLTDADIDASDIEVKVSQGTVTLEGSVRARWMKHQAEDIVDDLGGVKDIQNHLRVDKDNASHAAGSGQHRADNGSPATASTGTSATGSSTTGSSTTGASSGGTQSGSDIGGRSRH